MKTYNKEFPTSKRFIYTKKFKALIWLFCPKISPTLSKTAPFRVSMLTTEPRPKGICPSSSSSCNIPQMLNSSDDINLIPKRVPKLYTLYRPHYIELVNRSGKGIDPHSSSVISL